MSVDNKEQFNLLTGKILTLLVNACPVPVQITAETFNLPKGEFQKSQGGFSVGFYSNTPEEAILKDLLKWLEAENFIRERGGYYVATLQTLKLHNSVPNAISE